MHLPLVRLEAALGVVRPVAKAADIVLLAQVQLQVELEVVLRHESLAAGRAGVLFDLRNAYPVVAVKWRQIELASIGRLLEDLFQQVLEPELTPAVVSLDKVQLDGSRIEDLGVRIPV